MNQSDNPLRIGMLLFPNFTQLDLTGPFELLSAMENTQIDLVSKNLSPVVSNRNLGILPTITYEDTEQYDVLFVPGGNGVDTLMEDRQVLEFLKSQAASAKFVTAVCTGTLVLGAAGLIRGYRATTHWLSLDLLPIFGAIPVSTRVVVDRNRVTGGGVTAGIDFALQLIAKLRGEDLAKKIQLNLEYNPDPPFRSGHPSVAEPALVAQVREQTTERQSRRRHIAERIARYPN